MDMTAMQMTDGSAGTMREAAWVARCVGRGEGAPLGPEDVAAFADVLEPRTIDRDGVICREGETFDGVWILREGTVALSVGAGRARAIIHVLRAGDVDGDIQLLLGMPMPYTARALTDVQYLYLSDAAFQKLIQRNPNLARQWMSSIAMRLATSQNRVRGLLGQSLTKQVARLLLDESADGPVQLTQSTVAAMLGARRPSVNKILRGLEDDGLVTLEYRSISVTDRDALVKLG